MGNHNRYGTLSTDFCHSSFVSLTLHPLALLQLCASSCEDKSPLGAAAFILNILNSHSPLE